jgi:deoxyribonuclease V
MKSEFLGFDLNSYFYSMVKQIPSCMVSTFGHLARSLGDIKAAKACGYLLSVNPDPETIPGHRVVFSTGEVGQYSGAGKEKIQRLREEGIRTVDGHVSDFPGIVFSDFRSNMPLKAMANEQENMAKDVSLIDDYTEGNYAAVDVSYDDRFAYAAVVMEDGSKRTVKTLVTETKFPYIPGYLSYREFPAIEPVLRGFNGITLVDGNGILHPRGFGLASFTGVMLNIPTIGVAKSLLMGKVSGETVTVNGVEVGFVLGKRMIISPGHKISLESSVNTVKSLNDGSYPEILQTAHIETVKLRKGK